MARFGRVERNGKRDLRLRSAARHWVDLGRVELRPTVRLVSGRTLDQRGLPVAGALVETHPSGASHEERVRELRAISDQNGHFEIWGPLEGRPFDLSAKRDTHYPAFVRGVGSRREGLVLTLMRTGRLGKLPVVLDKGNPERILEAIISHGNPSRRMFCSIREGEVVFGDVLPGPVRASLRVLGEDSNLVNLDVLHVAPGQAGLPIERRNRIDLRGRLRDIDIAVLDVGGSRLPGARVTPFCRERKVAGFEYSASINGRIKVIGSGRGINLIVGAPGHRMRLVRGVTGHLDVELRPGLPAALRLQLPPELREDERKLTLLVGFDGRGKGSPDWVLRPTKDPIEYSAIIRARGRVAEVTKLVFEVPGTYRATAYRGGKRLGELRLTVRDVDRLQQFEFEIPLPVARRE